MERRAGRGQLNRRGSRVVVVAIGMLLAVAALVSGLVATLPHAGAPSWSFGPGVGAGAGAIAATASPGVASSAGGGPTGNTAAGTTAASAAAPAATSAARPAAPGSPTAGAGAQGSAPQGGSALGAHPLGAAAASPFGFRAKGMSGEVLGFVRGGDIGYALDRLDYRVVSTVAYFSLVGQGDGSLNRTDPAWRVWNSPTMDRVIARAHAAGTRVVFALQVFAWDGASASVARAILASATARERLADETAAEVVRRGIDGVNVDFEPIPLGQAPEFTDFVRRLRSRLDAAGPNYQLTVDVVGHFDSYDVAGLIGPGHADAIYLMGYPYAGSWSRHGESMAPYDGVGYDVKAAIAGLLRWVPRNRLIVGMPYYGHLWPTVSGAPFAATTGPGTDINYSDAIVAATAHGLQHLNGLDTAWSAFQVRDCAACPSHWDQLYFDDAATLAAKWRYIQSQRLLGIGIWTMPFEGSPGPLDAAMRAAFLRHP